MQTAHVPLTQEDADGIEEYRDAREAADDTRPLKGAAARALTDAWSVQGRGAELAAAIVGPLLATTEARCAA